jgi:hypothetical protein
VTCNITPNLNIDVIINSKFQRVDFNQNSFNEDTLARGFILHGDEYNQPIHIVIKVDGQVKMDETISL